MGIKTQLNSNQLQQIADSATRTLELCRVLEYEQMEKWPKFYPNPNMKNHARKAKESISAIQTNAGYIMKTKDKDYVSNHTYALWRIFDKLMRLPEEQLFEYAEGLEKLDLLSQEEQAKKVA